MLERLRLASDSAAGRRYPEPAHPYRKDYQRDRDRVVHARAFRRLEGKTQVFAARQGDHFRNRLTHTIEVAQVARTVAHTLGLNEDYTEALALAHDLGHPPFGHTGEKELNRQMKKHADDFEHNRHSLRIVDLLENRYARFTGLNLTGEVREGIIKHSREIPVGDADFADLLPGLRPPLEAQLLDAADEIAYLTADLDDAFGAGLVSTEELADTVPLFKGLAEQVDTQYPGATPRIRFWEIQRQVMNQFIGGLIEGTAYSARAAAVSDVQDVRRYPRRIAVFTSGVAEVTRQLKSILVNRVYDNPELKRVRAEAERRVGALFEFLMTAPDNIPSAYREMLEDAPTHRVVCDYVAGMTDCYFDQRYDELVGGATRA